MENIELTVSNSLILKTLNLEDLDTVFSALEANQSYLNFGLSEIRIEERKIETKAFVENYLSSSAEGDMIRLGVWAKDVFMGSVCLVNIDKKSKKASLTYWFIDEHYQNEYLMKSCTTLITYGFSSLNLIRIELLCFEHNERSCAVAEKLKFSKEGIFRSYIKIENEYFNIAVYSTTIEKHQSHDHS